MNQFKRLLAVSTIAMLAAVAVVFVMAPAQAGTAEPAAAVSVPQSGEVGTMGAPECIKWLEVHGYEATNARRLACIAGGVPGGADMACMIGLGLTGVDPAVAAGACVV